VSDPGHNEWVKVRKWESDAVAEIEAQVPTHPFEIAIGVRARRAGTARRRLRRIAALLEPHGYTLHVVDPVGDRSNGRWSTARFRNPVYSERGEHTS